MATDQTDTIIGAHVELTGSLKNQGSIEVHGHIKGDITSNAAVYIGETATVHGPIMAKRVDVAGRVEGSISAADHIELQPKSIVQGDLMAKQLTIKPGAIFVGTSKMELPATPKTTEPSPELAETPEATPKRKPRLEIE